jgi:hypothetical protein
MPCSRTLALSDAITAAFRAIETEAHANDRQDTALTELESRLLDLEMRLQLLDQMNAELWLVLSAGATWSAVRAAPRSAATDSNDATAPGLSTALTAAGSSGALESKSPVSDRENATIPRQV